jgi:polysaccharide export outer membrane protein
MQGVRRIYQLSRASAFCAVVLTAACSSTGPYVWVTELPKEYTEGRSLADYVINDGDTVSIRVFNQEALSTKAKVRSDGRVAMPVLGDIDVRGKRPSALKTELETRLKGYVNAPSVTVTVEEFQPILVSVLGEVAKAGSYPLDPRASVAQALASAGGLTDFASRGSIYVVRSFPHSMRVRFTYDDISRGTSPSLDFVLRNGDLVVVE